MSENCEMQYTLLESEDYHRESHKSEQDKDNDLHDFCIENEENWLLNFLNRECPWVKYIFLLMLLNPVIYLLAKYEKIKYCSLKGINTEGKIKLAEVHCGLLMISLILIHITISSISWRLFLSLMDIAYLVFHLIILREEIGLLGKGSIINKVKNIFVKKI
jgi:hypothetical protein